MNTNSLALQELIFPITLFVILVIYTLVLILKPFHTGLQGMKNQPPPPKKRPVSKSRKEYLSHDPKLRYPTPNMRENINKEYEQNKSE